MFLSAELSPMNHNQHEICQQYFEIEVHPFLSYVSQETNGTLTNGFLYPKLFLFCKVHLAEKRSSKL